MRKTLLPILVAVGLAGSALTGDLANGLIHYYSFNGNAYDTVGSNNVTIIGDVTIDN